MRSDDALLLDMLTSAKKIIRSTKSTSESEFHKNEMMQSAVIRELQIIGEAARLVSDETKSKYGEIAWHSITGMRNRLIHEYFDVRLDIVWYTLSQDIAPLIKTIELYLPSE